MKYLKLSTICFFLIAISFSIMACGDKDDDPKSKKESYATADVIIGNGIAFDFKGDHATVVSATGTRLGINFLDTDKGISIYLSLIDHKGIRTKSYTLSIKAATEKEEAAASVVMRPVDTDLFPEKFDSKTNLGNDFWNDGTGSITITSIDGKWVSGTFSATIYSKSGDESRITNGVFKAKVDYEF